MTHVNDAKQVKASQSSNGKPEWRDITRIIGSVLILALVFWIAPSQLPAELDPPVYDEATFNAEQQEGYEQVMKGVNRKMETLEITVVDGVTMYSDNGRRPTPKRPDWLSENNEPMVPDNLKERIAKRATFAAPSWMGYGDTNITYAEHNGLVTSVKFFGFLGLASSISLYLVFFWAFPGRRKRKNRMTAASWLASMVVLFGYIMPKFTIFTMFKWPLIFFGVPMFTMFLLWAVTRKPNEQEAVDNDPTLPEEHTGQPA